MQAILKTLHLRLSADFDQKFLWSLLGDFTVGVMSILSVGDNVLTLRDIGPMPMPD